MYAQNSSRRLARVPVGQDDDSHATPIDCGGADDQQLMAQLDFATVWYDQAMTSTDWEVTSRGLRRARDMAVETQRELSLKGEEANEEIQARCASLLADTSRASCLLQARFHRVSVGTA